MRKLLFVRLLSDAEGCCLQRLSWCQKYLVVGGYGTSMSSNYIVLRTVAEVMIEKGEMKLLRKQQSLEGVTSMFE